MAITDLDEQYKRLRSYLTKYIHGKNTDAVLTALATSSAHLINNISAVNDQLYIVTASGQYLDQRLADFGIVRPPAIGLSDEIFRQIGIEVKNRKQVRDLINNLLDAIFGDELVKAISKSGQLEPYNLIDGDTLMINFDESHTVTVTFRTNDFQNIATAKAQEVADIITKTLRNLGLTGAAIAKNDGDGFFVELISDTIGPVSSVTVTGGSAQNKLRFDSIVPAGGNGFTQWTLAVKPGGIMRFTWSAGADPQLGKVDAGDYVNIFDGGFSSSSNIGSYTILTSAGGIVGVSYFEIYNPLGTPGIVVQGADDAVLFYNPVRKTITSQYLYAAVYQTRGRILQIFMPASTRIVRRERIGASYLHDPPRGDFTFNANANSGDQFSITTTTMLIAGTDFVIDAVTANTMKNLANKINTISGLDATVGTKVVSIFNDSPLLSLTISYTGVADIVASGPQGDPTSVQPDQPGPYMYDLAQPFVVSDIGTILDQNLDGTMSRVFQVKDASNFPDEQGYLILGYGSQEQEGPIPYIARPSNSTLIISPAYTLKNFFEKGADVALVSRKSSVILSKDGTDYPFYLTDVASGRIYAQDLINSIAAVGVSVVFTVLFPNDIGLGKWGTAYSENPQIWGE